MDDVTTLIDAEQIIAELELMYDSAEELLKVLDNGFFVNPDEVYGVKVGVSSVIGTIKDYQLNDYVLKVKDGNSIYDEMLSKRNCNNCRHWNQIDDSKYGICNDKLDRTSCDMLCPEWGEEI